MIYRKPTTNAEVKAVDLLQRYDYPQSRTRNTLLLLASGVSWYRVRQRMRLRLDTDPEAFFLWAEGWAEEGFAPDENLFAVETFHIFRRLTY